MTFERMAEGLQLLLMQLANRMPTHECPPGWPAHEWAYVCGIASHAILKQRDVLMGMVPKPQDAR